jgi:hypothetical protein
MMNQFYLYVRSFYGTQGLYPMGANLADIIKATDIYLSRINTRFEGDSFDREEVRDILIASFGYIWPDADSAEQPSVARATDEVTDQVAELNFEGDYQ